MELEHRLVDSGVGWIGKMPAHWKIVPAKALFSLRSEKARSTDVHLTPSQKYGVLPQTEYMEITGARVVLNLTDSGQMKHVETGDFVSHLRSFQGGLELARLSGKVSGAYTVLTPRLDQHPGFWRYALKSDTYVQALQTTTDQLRDGQSIRMKEFSLIQLPIVPLDEQKAIADFLDRELAQIDALIEKQNLLVTAAKNRMAALIESQIWANAGSDGTSLQSVRFGAYVSLISEKSEHDNAVFLDQIESWTGRRTLVEVELDGTEASSIGMKFRPGDVLFGKLRPYLAKVWLADSEGVAFGDIYVLRSKVLTSEYVKYLLLSERVIGLIDSTSYGTKMPRANWDAIKTIRIPLPDENKQREIVTKLDAQSVWTAQAIEKLHSLNRDLFERRQSLISAAVTGKIDVRKVA